MSGQTTGRDVDPHLATIDDLHELADLVADRRHVFVRYSRGPAEDSDRPSRDYESGLDMPGLSVTPLHPETWWTRPLIDWVARRLCKYLDLAAAAPDRRPWLLTGEVAAYGPDHEPLVADVHPIAWVGPHAVDEARARYRRRSDVGRDSMPEESRGDG